MGSMGSGKTTAARLLSETFGFTLLEENFGENVFLPRFYREMDRWAFHSQTFFLMEKTRQILDAARVLSEVNDPQWGKNCPGIIQDTPIEQDVYSYARAQHMLGHMDDAEWRLYQKIYTSFEPYFPKPSLFVYLDTSVPVLERRIASRGRSYEQEIPESYLALLDKLNHDWLKANSTIPVLIIQTDGLNIVRSREAQAMLIGQVAKRLHLPRKK